MYDLSLIVTTTADVQLHSPLATFTGHIVASRVGLAPILRSGVGMEDALLALLPDAPVYHLGLFRSVLPSTLVFADLLASPSPSNRSNTTLNSQTSFPWTHSSSSTP